jgi:hypothetical protein
MSTIKRIDRRPGHPGPLATLIDAAHNYPEKPRGCVADRLAARTRISRWAWFDLH